jgi:hypothetical protein
LNFLFRIILIPAALFVLLSGETCAQSFHRATPESALHVLLSAGITMIGCGYVSALKPDMPLGQKYLIGGGVALAAGVGKEFLDLSMGKFIDYTDIAFDIVGIGTGLFLQYEIWDRKKIRGRVGLELSKDQYLATLYIRF